MASSPSSSRPSPPLPRSPIFTPILEMDKEGEVDEPEPEKQHPTPLPSKSAAAAAAKKDDRQLSVFFNKCRPSSRDKTTVVPVDNHYGSGFSPANPKALLHSLLLTLTRKSPRPPPPASTSSASAAAEPRPAGPTDGGEWRLAAQELSRKLLHVTRRRDDALLESSRLKHSVSELERKLDKLESYCLDLKSALDKAVAGTARPLLPTEPFIAAVADARAAVRALTRALAVHVRPGRVASLLKLPIQNTGILLIYMESLLNRVFYEDFERLTEEESRILDPGARFEMNRAGYEAVRGLTWEDVLCKGTKHYSEGLSRFCDKKMSEVVGMMGWARAWPEGLLQAFFGAAKGVWVVYLLSRCVHPAVPILRAESGAEFDARYMEHVVVGERGRRAGNQTSPVNVRVMVAPGFYLYSGGYGVIKCKVVCGQTIALFAMEPPVSLDGEDIRNEKVKVLRSIRPLNLDDVVLGQHKASPTDKVDTYMDSLTPTFFATALYIDNSRWDGVPFLIKTGMGLIKHRAEIRIQFHNVPGNIYRERIGHNIALSTNELVLRDLPDEAILLKVNNKVPGLGLQLDASELNLLYKEKYNIEIPDSYEHLLLDVIDGDSHLFMRSDELEAAWNILTPVLREIDEKKIIPEFYEYGGRGPVGAYYLDAKHGIRWVDD